LNRFDANVLSIREIVVVEIRDAVFQSIRFVNLDVVVKLISRTRISSSHNHFSFFSMKTTSFHFEENRQNKSQTLKQTDRISNR
jgi:hypothetical protein